MTLKLTLAKGAATIRSRKTTVAVPSALMLRRASTLGLVRLARRQLRRFALEIPAEEKNRSRWVRGQAERYLSGDSAAEHRR